MNKQEYYRDTKDVIAGLRDATQRYNSEKTIIGWLNLKARIEEAISRLRLYDGKPGEHPGDYD